MKAVREAIRALKAEAEATNERRLVVVAGSRTASDATTAAVCDAASVIPVVVSKRDVVPTGRRLSPTRTDELLGTTEACVVVDCHDSCRPNTLGRAVGAVDGGGLFVLCTPSLDEWPARRDGFDERLAVPPFGLDDVGGGFRSRLVDTIRSHRGIAIIDAETTEVIDNGLTHPAPRLAAPTLDVPVDGPFPSSVYEACLTADQLDAVRACESLTHSGVAVVLEANRGRGKSSAAGLAAAGLAADGCDVLVTATGYRNATAVFERAAERLNALDLLDDDHRDGDRSPELRTADGRVRFVRPLDALDQTADVLVVDEAAALPVRTLESLLDVAPSACFATTVHGYEGAGRGFDVRFRDRLARRRTVETVVLTEPIRYAVADPVETWAFRALCLDARPPVDQLITGAYPERSRYTALDTDALLEDENLLREAFGLLVYAHYRTEPDDLARLLDAPNITVRALMSDGHVVSVALLAREGALSDATREAMYTGSRVRGNMLPDVLTSQLRDPDGGSTVGVRVMRIATHHAIRSNGFGSKLLSDIEHEFSSYDGDCGHRPVDWLGVGYGATPELLSFWNENGYTTIHLSTTRNATSGEHSALMLRGLTDAGRTLERRHADWFGRRVGDALAEPLSELTPDVVRAALHSADARVPLDLDGFEWRVVVAAAYGPGMYDVAPRPFRRLALRALLDETVGAVETERLLVAKVLQGRPWNRVADELGYVSRRECMRALGAAYQPLLEAYAPDEVLDEAERFR